MKPSVTGILPASSRESDQSGGTAAQLLPIGARLPKAIIGDHDGGGVDLHGVEPACRAAATNRSVESRSPNEMTAVLHLRRIFAVRHNTVDGSGQLADVAAELLADRSAGFGAELQIVENLPVLSFDLAQSGPSRPRAARQRRAAELQQRPRHATHRRHHDEWQTPSMALDDPDGTPDASRILERSSAELHDNHRSPPSPTHRAPSINLTNWHGQHPNRVLAWLARVGGDRME